jgi:hypothetical protein
MAARQSSVAYMILGSTTWEAAYARTMRLAVLTWSYLAGHPNCFPGLPGEHYRSCCGPFGASISGATVSVTSVERNTVSEAISNASGIYLAQYLLPGQ